MKRQTWCWILSLIWLAMAPIAHAAAAPDSKVGPVDLQVNNLNNPLGIDDGKPRFSWALHDSTQGARQSAYQVLVATRGELLEAGRADVWDSGRVESGQSMNVAYEGPALKASTRYFWRVMLWGGTGNAYPATEVAWWETGMLNQDAWHAQWIGYETTEEKMVRQAPAMWVTSADANTLAAEKSTVQNFAYRRTVTLEKPVRRAALFATGQDTVSAWINGAQLLSANPLPAWKQLPWKKFVRADATRNLSVGANVIAIEAVYYVANPNGMATSDAPPMIATLVVEYEDGTSATFASNTDWRAAVHAAPGWQLMNFDDTGWKKAIVWNQSPDPLSVPLGHPWISESVKALRHTFDLTRPVKSARLYSTALGAYEVFLNGKRVGADVLAPGWTDYRERIFYQTYDVTAQLATGKNAIAALLAPGWYQTPLEWFQQPNNYGDTPPAFRAQLRIEYSDGTIDWVETDTSWQASTSNILHSEIYDGESQDARLVQEGWETPGFAATNWQTAIAIEPKQARIVAQDFQPILIERTVAAKSVTQPSPGVYVYDFGQNLTGVERLRVHGSAGANVRVRFAELVNEDGTIYTDNMRTAKVTDNFTLSGNGIDEFIPQFTFHGFRYAEVTGLTADPGMDAITALVIHTAAPFTAQLETGNTMVNKLWSNILWGQRSNFVGVPTDCPQRDERLGWMADAQVFWRTATYNMDLAAFSRKFSGDMRGTQAGTPFYGIYAPGTAKEHMGAGAGWTDAGVIIPWTSWLQTGDTSVIQENWAAMQKYLDAIEAANPGGLWTKESGIPFGDWLSPEGRTDQVLVATAYWAYDVTLMRDMAHATGRKEDEQKYARLFDKIRGAFDNKFVHQDGFVAGADNSPSPFGDINNPDAKSTGGDTQTGYVLALHMNLLPDKLRAAAAQKLVNKIEANRGLLATGFLGTPYLLEELTKTGHARLAYKLLLNTEYPSWGYLVGHGATTMWERWNGDQMKGDPSMNSYNHYAYGAVADWIYRHAAGVDATPLDAGFHTVLLHPEFDARLGSVDFTYQSPYGVIRSGWTVKGAVAQWHLTIPPNTKGWLRLNAIEAKGYILDGMRLDKSTHAKATSHDGVNGYELDAGTYTFSVQI